MSETKRAEVISIGIDGKNRTVVRLILPDGSRMDVETNHVCFARLAAKGVRVVNE
jgi:hypothetical protein